MNIPCMPSLDAIEATYKVLSAYVVRTPIVKAFTSGLDFELSLKLEFLQASGTFKVRGAMANVFCGNSGVDDLRRRGLVAVSAGNHAIAVAYTGHQLGVSATVVMPEYADVYRIKKCRSLNAQVEIVKDASAGFAMVESLVSERGMCSIPPFSGEWVTAGAAGVGLEIFEDVPKADVVVVAIGGGGLASGIASVAHHMAPDCEIIGVEPLGSDVMRQSIAAGYPLSITCSKTIADTLSPPMTLQYSFDICSELLSDIVVVDDHELRRGMLELHAQYSIAVEPACAAAYAAITGVLKDRLRGKRVVAVLCGSNQSFSTFSAICNGSF
jgi:threonine dehydratase